MKRPIPDSYWIDFQVLPAAPPSAGALLAGEYPGARTTQETRAKLARFLDAGVSLFLDLTEDGEYGLRPYAPDATELAAVRNQTVQHRRLPIRDVSTPRPEEMRHILDTIDEALAAGETVYVHCFGGIGRTGTVIGCWLVRHGLPGEEALAQIAAWRQGTPDGHRTSPETEAQSQMVLNWSE